MIPWEPKQYVAIGPGFCGETDSIIEALSWIEANQNIGGVYILFPIDIINKIINKLKESGDPLKYKTPGGRSYRPGGV